MGEKKLRLINVAWNNFRSNRNCVPFFSIIECCSYVRLSAGSEDVSVHELTIFTFGLSISEPIDCHFSIPFHQLSMCIQNCEFFLHIENIPFIFISIVCHWTVKCQKISAYKSIKTPFKDMRMLLEPVLWTQNNHYYPFVWVDLMHSKHPLLWKVKERERERERDKGGRKWICGIIYHLVTVWCYISIAWIVNTFNGFCFHHKTWSPAFIAFMALRCTKNPFYLHLGVYFAFTSIK